MAVEDGPEHSQHDDLAQASVSLLAWALNEEENVSSFLSQAHEFLDSVASNYEIVVIDDGSTDATNALLREAELADSRLRIFTHPRNLGVGVSFANAIQRVEKDWFIWQTLDWSYDLNWFKENFLLHQDFDIMHGSRWLAEPRILRHIGSRADTRWKAVISIVNLTVVRILLGIPLSDVQNVAMIRSAMTKNIRLSARGSAVSPELLHQCLRAKTRLIEVPVKFLPRRRGVAKGTRPSSIVRSIVELVLLRRRLGRLDRHRITADIVRWSDSP